LPVWNNFGFSLLCVNNKIVTHGQSELMTAAGSYSQADDWVHRPTCRRNITERKVHWVNNSAAKLNVQAFTTT